MAYYDSIAPSYDSLHKEEQIRKLAIIRENLLIQKRDKLLDVGCGTGFSLQFFKCNCIGIEPSQEMAQQNKNLDKIIIGCAESLPFPDDFFDLVISITAIHNFADIEKGLREMKRVGKDRFAFSVLKKSRQLKRIKRLIQEIYPIKKTIDEKHDLIFLT